MEYILYGPKGGVLKEGVEITGAEFGLPKGYILDWNEQSLFTHTEGKVIEGLKDAGLLGPGRVLAMKGTLAPCPACQRLIQDTSAEFKMIIQYIDAKKQIWTWINGVLQ